MDAHSQFALVGLLVLAVAAVLLSFNSCRHVDEQGTSTLAWSYHEGRQRGFCWQCERWTRGWAIPAPVPARRLVATKAAAMAVSDARAVAASRDAMTLNLAGGICMADGEWARAAEFYRESADLVRTVTAREIQLQKARVATDRANGIEAVIP